MLTAIPNAAGNDKEAKEGPLKSSEKLTLAKSTFRPLVLVVLVAGRTFKCVVLLLLNQSMLLCNFAHVAGFSLRTKCGLVWFKVVS